MYVSSIGDGIENVAVKQRSFQRGGSLILTPSQIKSLRNVVRFLNDKDKDILYLIFCSGKKQCNVGSVIGRSQPSLCYDVRKIRKRLEFICYIDRVFPSFISFLNSSASDEYSPVELDIMSCLLLSTSLTQTASILNYRQIKIRYKFKKILKKMVDMGHWEMYEMFRTVGKSLNMIRRVYPFTDDLHQMKEGVSAP